MGRWGRLLAVLWLFLSLLVGCGTDQARLLPGPAPSLEPEASTPVEGLSADQVATLESLVQVDDYPLYTMRFYGGYPQPDGPAGAAGARREVVEARSGPAGSGRAQTRGAWACSLFAALADEGGRLYGRNFDWRSSPAVLLFTDSPDGYASVSMVDIAYLGFDGPQAQGIAELPLEARRGLLDAPLWPFDGMNEHGLAVGMAAVPAGQGPPDPAKTTVDSLGIIRLMLDRARDVGEAVALLQGYNVEMGGGPDLHYLLADRSGRSALVEFYEGETVVIGSDEPWHLATNFLRAAAGASATGQCWRYDRMERVLMEAGGSLGVAPAMDLLAEVAGELTQWSVIYEMSTGTVQVTMGRQYEIPHAFHLRLVDPQDAAQSGRYFPRAWP
jgi:hypothetical protein